MISSLIFPSLIILPVIAAAALLDRGVSNLIVTPLAVGVLAAVVAVVERIRPAHVEHVKLDQPAHVEAGHFLFGVELGFVVALGAILLAVNLVRALIPIPAWPLSLPLVVQLLIAVFLYEGSSYWQHRLFHRVPFLWRFHALHHSGERLNFVRAVRFHFFDIVIAVFMAYFPLMLLGASDEVMSLMGVLISALGIVQHANLRLRIPAWLDWWVCTPAVHRHHHSRLRRESDSNYGTSVMLFDLIFGTFAKPSAGGPAAIGIEGDQIPAGFLPQVLAPFQRR